MPNPAIVLMTDPSRCNLGDVHHLVQALLEIQQMGQHAIPQAFCDHPAAAREFIDAYAQAYPQLVLEDGEIPTPGHLHALMTTGQIGALGQPPELTPPGDAQRLTEQNGANGFPIVVLTLGSSQALLDALQQSPAVRESIRLIDVAPDGEDAQPVSIADAVAMRGLDGEPWEHDRSSTERPELDDIGSASKTDLTSLALHDDHMNLDVVETAEVASSDPFGYEHDAEPEPGPAAPSAAAVQPAPVAVAQPVAEPALSNDSLTASTVAEPVLEAAPQVVTAWPSDTELVEPITPPVELEAQPPDENANAGDGRDRQPSTGSAADGDAPEDGDPPQKEGDAAGKPAPRARDQDDDVYYPPVGSLIAGADVLYPALDQDDAQGVLRELAAVLLDDGVLDPDLASALMAPHDGLPASARPEAIMTVRSSDNVVTLEDHHFADDRESEDSLADAGAARPLHDSDL